MGTGEKIAFRKYFINLQILKINSCLDAKVGSTTRNTARDLK